MRMIESMVRILRDSVIFIPCIQVTPSGFVLSGKDHHVLQASKRTARAKQGRP